MVELLSWVVLDLSHNRWGQQRWRAIGQTTDGYTHFHPICRAYNKARPTTRNDIGIDFDNLAFNLSIFSVETNKNEMWSRTTAMRMGKALTQKIQEISINISYDDECFPTGSLEWSGAHDVCQPEEKANSNYENWSWKFTFFYSQLFNLFPPFLICWFFSPSRISLRVEFFFHFKLFFAQQKQQQQRQRTGTKSTSRVERKPKNMKNT